MSKIERAGDEPITTSNNQDAELIARYVRIGKQPTTFCLETAAWNLLCKISREDGVTVDQLCTEIAEVTAPDTPFVNAVRCYVLGHICDEIPDELLPVELLNLRRNGRTVQ